MRLLGQFTRPPLQAIRDEEAVAAAGGALDPALFDVVVAILEGAPIARAAIRLCIVVDELAAETALRRFALAKVSGEGGSAPLGLRIPGQMPGPKRAAGKLALRHVYRPAP